MIKSLSDLLSLTLFSLIVLLHQEVKAEEAKEDCIGFNPENIAVKNIQGRWKLVDGSHYFGLFQPKERSGSVISGHQEIRLR